MVRRFERHSVQQSLWRSSAGNIVQADALQHPEQRYDLKGKVTSVDKRGRTVTIAHEAIEGYMDAMAMPFK
jgi:Cu/Ag efflux protein CusF